MGMEKRTLGKTGLNITGLGYGAMELRHVDEAMAGRLLNAALDGGINYIDTSPDYGPSQEFIGRAVAHRRNDFILASKCGCNIDATGKGIAEQKHIWSRAKLTENIEQTLRLLKTDHLDVWQMHGPFPAELPGGKNDDVIKTMQEIKQQGKVRAIGMSFKTGGKTDAEQEPSAYGYELAPFFLAWNVFDMIQIVYSGLERKSEDIIAGAGKNGVGVVARGITRKYKPDYDQIFARAGLNDLCEAGESMSDMLIRFTLSHPAISTMIIGTKNLDHMAANIRAASKGALKPDVYAKAKQCLDAAGIKAG
jgi:aryl-alcohol dehydrogenase-like predicted oxidoreductase